jgi:hypothetical protein
MKSNKPIKLIKNKKSKLNKVQTKNEIREKSFKTVKAKITHKSQRKFYIERVGKIVDILPKFVKFYDKLRPNEIMAIKYYKSYGSRFQSQILADHCGKTKDDNKREFTFPFSLREEVRFREDISPYINELLPFTKSFDIKELPKYIETSYKARITLLNSLDKIYDNPECPRLTGDEILFRGMEMNSLIKKLKVGDTYLFKNFISTTVDKQIAENYSYGDCLFVLIGLKDIPFIYMPNNKAYGKQDFSKFIMAQQPFNDFSEYTLPRNLEFKLERIEKKPLNNPERFDIKNTNTFEKLQKVLKKQGYLDSKQNNNITEETNLITKPSKAELIEQHIYPRITVYYCTLHNWHPRKPIDYEEITKNAKFVLDKKALDSWSRENPRFM